MPKCLVDTSGTVDVAAERRRLEKDLAAAQKELPAARIRELHEKAEARMRTLLERGQREGAFRADLPVSWLLATTHVVMNGAAEEVRAGRLDAEDAPWFIDAILLPAFANTAPPREGAR